MEYRPINTVIVEREVEVAAPTDAVWKQITDSSMISEWMEGDVEIDPVPGGRITLRPGSGPVVWGTVEEVLEERRIQWSWRTDDGLPSLIEIELSPTGEDSTILTVRETLLPWRISGPGGYTEWPMAKALSSGASTS